MNLAEDHRNSDRVFLSDPKASYETIDYDGLPIPGRLYMEGDPYYSVFEIETNSYEVHKYKYTEPAYCGSVRIIEEGEANNTTIGKCVRLSLNCLPYMLTYVDRAW